MWKYWLLPCLFFSLITGSIEANEIDDLIPCIIQIESSGNPLAVGSSGEIGLCQISPIVLKEYNQRMEEKQVSLQGHLIAQDIMNRNERKKIVEKEFPKYNLGDLYNPSINVKIAKWYLDRLRGLYIPPKYYSIELLLSCYNAGPTRMRKNGWDWHKAPKSTLHYIKKVLRCLK